MDETNKERDKKERKETWAKRYGRSIHKQLDGNNTKQRGYVVKRLAGKTYTEITTMQNLETAQHHCILFTHKTGKKGDSRKEERNVRKGQKKDRWEYGHSWTDRTKMEGNVHVEKVSKH